MIQEASLVGVFKVILWIALIYYAIKVLSRIFAPILIKKIVKKAESKFGQGFGQQQKEQEAASKKEGEISIDKIPENKSSNNNVGEYVDYEEIE